MAFQKILVHRPNFDDWRLQGVSAYCGGLWLALEAAIAMVKL